MTTLDQKFHTETPASSQRTVELPEPAYLQNHLATRSGITFKAPYLMNTAQQKFSTVSRQLLLTKTGASQQVLYPCTLVCGSRMAQSWTRKWPLLLKSGAPDVEAVPHVGPSRAGLGGHVPAVIVPVEICGAAAVAHI